MQETFTKTQCDRINAHVFEDFSITSKNFKVENQSEMPETNIYIYRYIY